MSLLPLSVAILVGSSLILALILYGAYQDTQKVGTALLPLYKWCSAKYLLEAIPVAFLFGASWFGLFLGADGAVVPTVIKGIPVEIPVRSVLVTQVLLGVLGVFATVCYGLTELLWNQSENKFSPLIVAATSNCYCTYCGNRVIQDKPLGGYCPVCSAAPDQQCDPNRHGRHEATGDPLPSKKKGGVGSLNCSRKFR